MEEVGDFWESVIKINSWQRNRIYKIIVEKLYGNLANKKIAILGFAFKANTNDTRESPAINICNDLLKEGAFLSIHDPKVEPNVILRDLNVTDKDYALQKKVSIESEINVAVSNADAILILTDWDEYKNLDLQSLSNKMRKPAWLFDTRSVINKNLIKETDLKFWQIGLGN